MQELEKEINKIIHRYLKKAFELGVRWKEQQMMEKAIEGELCSSGLFIPLISVGDKDKVSNIKFGDKIKIIIIKE